MKGGILMGNRLRELREEKGLTLKELVDDLKKVDLKISSDTLAKYERGDREPKLERWQKLADYFDVPVSYLQGLDDSRNVNQISFFKISSYDDVLEKCLSKKERDELSDIENKIIKVYISRKMDLNTRDELKYDLEKIIEKYDNFMINSKDDNDQEKS